MSDPVMESVARCCKELGVDNAHLRGEVMRLRDVEAKLTAVIAELLRAPLGETTKGDTA